VRYLRLGGLFDGHFIADLFLIVPVPELQKSVNISEMSESLVSPF